MAMIIMPSAWRAVTSGEHEFSCAATTVGEALDSLFSTFPSLKARLVDDQGNIHSYVNIFVDGENMRVLQRRMTPLSEDSVIMIVPPVVGG
jgi:molybdopterin converting factor small subunit